MNAKAAPPERMTEPQRIAGDIVAKWKDEMDDSRGLDPLREAIADAILAASCAPRTPAANDEAWDLVRRWRANGGRMILLKYAANELEAALTEPPIPAEKAPTR